MLFSYIASRGERDWKTAMSGFLKLLGRCLQRSCATGTSHPTHHYSVALLSVRFWSHTSQEAQGQNYTLILIVVLLQLIGRYFADFKEITENARR